MPVGDDLDFQTRYRILRSTSSNSRFRTHAALEQRTGRAVMVHMVDAADPPTIGQIREQVRLLPPAEARHVLELAELPTGFAVVTEFIQGLAFFSEWLDEKSPTQSLPAPDSMRTNAEPDPAKGGAAFAPTVIIQSPVAPPKPATDSASAAAPTVVRPAVKASAPTAAPPTPAPVTPVTLVPPVTPVAPPPSPPPTAAPTQVPPSPVMATPPTPPTPSPVVPPVAKSAEHPEPGEYTRIFKLGGAPVTSEPTAHQPPSPPSVPKPVSPTEAAPSAAAAAPSHLSAAPPDPTPTPPPAPAIPEAKPGEYTQIFGARSAPPTRPPQQSSPSPFGDAGSNLPAPPASERASGGGATSTFGAWGAPSPSPSSDLGFGRSDPGSKLPPSSFPPLPPSPMVPSSSPTPSILPTSIPAASSTPPTPSISSTPFGGGAIPAAGLSPLLQGPSASLPTPPASSPLSSRADDPAQRSTPGLSPLPAIQPPVFGGGLPPLQGLGSSLDSPFAQRGGAKPAGGYTQINKSVTPAPPPAVAAPAKVVTSKREGFRAPTALVIVIAVVVILAITLILYFALRAPVRPLVAPATNGAASSAPASGAPQTTPVTTPPSTATTPPQKNP